MMQQLTNPSVAGTIRGIDGGAYDVSQIQFDPETYHFFYGPTERDITNDILRSDKLLLVPEFDVRTENFRLSNEKRTGTGTPGSLQPLEESTGKIFLEQVTTEPLKAPLETLTRTVDELIANGGLRKLALLAGVGVAVYLLIKHADN